MLILNINELIIMFIFIGEIYFFGVIFVKLKFVFKIIVNNVDVIVSISICVCKFWILLIDIRWWNVDVKLKCVYRSVIFNVRLIINKIFCV